MNMGRGERASQWSRPRSQQQELEGREGHKREDGGHEGYDGCELDRDALLLGEDELIGHCFWFGRG